MRPAPTRTVASRPNVRSRSTAPRASWPSPTCRPDRRADRDQPPERAGGSLDWLGVAGDLRSSVCAVVGLRGALPPVRRVRRTDRGRPTPLAVGRPLPAGRRGSAGAGGGLLVALVAVDPERGGQRVDGRRMVGGVAVE